MNNDLIKKDYSKKIKLLQNCNKHYYDKAKPIFSDEEFDLLKKENMKSSYGEYLQTVN